MGEFKDLTGQRFGRLTVIEKAKNIGEYTTWKCKCDCGNMLITRGNSLKSGRTKSCGCYNHEVRINQKIFLTHGMSKTRQFVIWYHILERCHNVKDKEYKNYGGRGITVCNKWLTFEGFWEDMQEGYSDKLTIDRIDTNKGYYKENCKWSTPTQQANNRRNNVFFTAFGVTDTLANLCRIFNATYKTVFSRVRYQNMDIETALTKPNMR